MRDELAGIIFEHWSITDGLDLTAQGTADAILEYLEERLARAWDKGYNKGREDGRNDGMFLSSTPREPNSSRNPYRHRPESGTLSE